MVELATSTPLQDHCIAQAPFQVISSLLSTVSVSFSSFYYYNNNRLVTSMGNLQMFLFFFLRKEIKKEEKWF